MFQKGESPELKEEAREPLEFVGKRSEKLGSRRSLVLERGQGSGSMTVLNL